MYKHKSNETNNNFNLMKNFSKSSSILRHDFYNNKNVFNNEKLNLNKLFFLFKIRLCLL